MIAEVFDVVDDGCCACSAEVVKAVCHEFAELLLVHADAETPLSRFLILMIIAKLRRQDLVEDHASERCLDKTVSLDAHLDFRLQCQLLMLIHQERFFDACNELALAQGARAQNRQIVGAKHHVLRRHDDRSAILRREDVVRSEHEDACLRLRFRRQRQMNRHLVAVKVRIVRCAGERMKLQCASFRQNRFKRLDAEAMQRRGAVQENGVLLDDFFEHIPDLRTRALDHVLGALDVLCESGTYEPLHDERFEEFERHFLRQTTLMKLELRTDNDDGASRIVYALAEKVLAEASLFAFEHVGKRLQRAVARSRDRTAAAAIVNQSVDSLLQHAFFVADDDIRSTEIQETLQTIVAIDDAAIKIIQIARRKTSAVELNHGAQLGRNDGDNVENHP